MALPTTFALDDTIVAIATPAGRGALGIVRLSGPEAQRIVGRLLGRREPLVPRRATVARIRDLEGPPATGRFGAPVVDEVVVTSFPAPRSYTGQDVVEVSAHGSPVVLQAIVSGAQAAGARLARPGEFTLRAFLTGKRDLVQAEAVADLIAAATPLQARQACEQLDGTLTRRLADIDGRLFDLIARLEASLDFPDEGYHFVGPSELCRELDAALEAMTALIGEGRAGRVIREGATVVVAGKPNVGKSSLFNVLVGSSRAIVTDVPGTTRDLITERIDLEGLAVTLVDTAGARQAADLLEREGVARGQSARRAADLIVLVTDRSEGPGEDDWRLLEETKARARIVVANKADLPAASGWDGPAAEAVVAISAKTGQGIPELRRALAQALLGGESPREMPGVSNLRHLRLLERARGHVGRARQAASAQTSEEFVLVDLHAARRCFDEVVGVRTSEDVLRHVFERFCIGK